MISGIPIQLQQINLTSVICLHIVKWPKSSIWPKDGTYQVQPLPVRVDLGVIAMKGYFLFPKAPAMKPRHQIWGHIQIVVDGWGVLPFSREVAGQFNNPNWALRWLIGFFA